MPAWGTAQEPVHHGQVSVPAKPPFLLWGPAGPGQSRALLQLTPAPSLSCWHGHTWLWWTQSQLGLQRDGVATTCPSRSLDGPTWSEAHTWSTCGISASRRHEMEGTGEQALGPTWVRACPHMHSCPQTPQHGRKH